jgi:hydrogenase nickel incorporation protein HypA/HybF
MHEVSLAQAIVDIVTERSQRDAFRRATVVHVELGELSHVMPEALAFGFDSASAGTPAEGARLNLIRCPGKAWCMDCSAEVSVPSRIAACPGCGGAKLVVTGGEEMRVTELEVV